MATCVNIRKKYLNARGIGNFMEWKEKPNSVYIGRNMSFYIKGATQSIWHNPYKLGKYTRDECLELYEDYIRKNEYLMSRLHEKPYPIIV